jgi:hypothetical protein
MHQQKGNMSLPLPKGSSGFVIGPVVAPQSMVNDPNTLDRTLINMSGNYKTKLGKDAARNAILRT